MPANLSIYHFIDRCGGLEEALKFLREIAHGKPMYKLARAKGMDPAYVSRVLSEHVEEWRPKLKPASMEAINLLIAEHKEAYDDARRTLAGEKESTEIIEVDFRRDRH